MPPISGLNKQQWCYCTCSGVTCPYDATAGAARSINVVVPTSSSASPPDAACPRCGGVFHLLKPHKILFAMVF